MLTLAVLQVKYFEEHKIVGPKYSEEGSNPGPVEFQVVMLILAVLHLKYFGENKIV